MVEQAWAGIDAGKGHHHVTVVDETGRRILSRRVANDETMLSDVISDVLTKAHEVTWAIDLADGPAALVIAILLQRRQKLVFLPGVAVNRASGTYRGEGKTDAKDAMVIADQARMRRDLRELRSSGDLVAELKMLTAHRADVAAERTRTINRLRGTLMSIFPGLERALDFTNKGPLILISLFQTPAMLLAVGEEQLEQLLKQHKVRPAGKLAASAINAGRSQQTHVAGETVAADLVARLATHALELDQELVELEKLISERFRSHSDAETISSLVGVGDLLGAEFVAATGGTLETFASADHLAGYAGLAPAPRDSGKRSGNLHRPKRYSRQLQRVFYTSALISIQHSPSSKAYYDRKRAEGKRHTQAVLALGRRRVNVLWAMLRDHRRYTEPVL